MNIPYKSKDLLSKSKYFWYLENEESLFSRSNHFKLKSLSLIVFGFLESLPLK